jgi:hypothetical protein
MSSDAEPLSAPVRATLDGYAEALLRLIAANLVKPRTPVPANELTDRIISTLTNPPVIDRRLRDLSDEARKLLALFGLTRRSRWTVGQLLTTLAAVGHAEGLAPVRVLFEHGLLYPSRADESVPLETFDAWLNSGNVLFASVFAHPQVAARAAEVPFGLPDLGVDGVNPAGARVADGLEWPLRVAAAVQLVSEAPFRRTQAGALFKRDLTRLQTHEILSVVPADHVSEIPEAGVLSVLWAFADGQLVVHEDELRPTLEVDLKSNSLIDTLSALIGSLTAVESWDPLRGYNLNESGLSATPSAAVCTLLLLAGSKGWVRPAAVAEWLWSNHPSWQGVLTNEAQKEQGRPWVESFLLGVLYPLRAIEVLDADGVLVRMSDLGRYLFAAGPRPADPPAFPQTLMVQPNGEILAYRQGLTPQLIQKLTRFARWKALGPACTLELTAEQTYRGLESGLTLAGIVQTLNQHGTRPVPPPVADLLQRWANKRERIGVYPSATLVEFQSPADLDSAISRGIVAVRVTDRIAICSDGAEPEFKFLRLTGNRDYDSRPSQCVTVANDGVSLVVDPGQSDLLFEAEINRLAEPQNGEPTSIRKFTLTPRVIKSAMQSGYSLADLDSWFVARTGQPLPAAARLFAHANTLPPSLASRRTVLQLPNAEATDGLIQWPETGRLVEDRLGPTSVTVDEANLAPLIEKLAELGLRVEQN